MSGRALRGNLPAELSGFIGRRREMSEVADALSVGRLVTLTGMGGVGKTRLALRVADRLHRAYPDGVWLVDLAALEDRELLTSTVVAALGVADRSARSAVSALVGFMEDKRLLLVLDNCDQLVDGCAALVGKVLAAAPGVRVLATSQQPLWALRELVVVVEPLSTPDPHCLPQTGDLSEFEAVRLFVERAREALPTFEVTPANRTAVARLCAQLDGHPLAIELAAARSRVLSVEQITARLDDQLGLLTAGRRTAPPRHRTLRAALEWSFGLCSLAERVLWARVSVFAGGFDLDAAEHVCAGDGIDPGDVFDLTANLVDKSVLVRESDEGSMARYRLLEAVRQYGRERLAASGEENILRSRHRDYYGDLARRAWSDFFSPRQVEWMLRLHREYPNLRLALHFCLAESGGGAHAGLEMVVTLRYIWIGTGRHRELLHWFTRALALDRQPTRAGGIALANGGYVAATLGDHETARRMLAEGRAVAEQLGDAYVHATVADNAGMAAVLERSPDLARAQALAGQALAGFRTSGDVKRFSIALMRAATIAVYGGDPRAVAYAEEYLALCEAHDAKYSTSEALANLALARWRQGEREQVAPLLHKALRLKQLVHDPWGTGMCLEIFAWHTAVGGNHERAAGLLGACQALERLSGAAPAELGPFAAHHEACEHAARQALGDAAYTAAFDQRTHLTLAEAISYGLENNSRKPAAARTTQPPWPVSVALTRREQQVAGLVAEGLSNREIATRLVISQRTAESHVEHILGKLGFTNRAQIATWAIGGGHGATGPA